ncbi:MAG: amino acid--tRNA ligase-related protein [Patescibacteria group bacterium]
MDIIEKIQARNAVKKSARLFFEKRGYVEVETPSFVLSPDMAPNLSYFTSEAIMFDGRITPGALITSPEYSLKNIIASGLTGVFEFARVWRNREPCDATHSPEFTMLEFYKIGMTFEDGIKETINLLETIAREVNGSPKVSWKGREYDLSEWNHISLPELFRERVGIDLANPSERMYIDALERQGIHYVGSDSISDLFNRLLIHFIEPEIAASQRPVVVAHYPRHEASLAKIDGNGFAERFEIFVGDLELCNGYGELTDATEQRARFNKEAEERKRLGKTVFPIDEELLAALSLIKEPLFGNAIGFDRFLMTLFGASSIEDILVSSIMSYH